VAVDDERAEILLIGCSQGRCRKADELISLLTVTWVTAGTACVAKSAGIY
jgi:hypothetical protein